MKKLIMSSAAAALLISTVSPSFALSSKEDEPSIRQIVIGKIVDGAVSAGNAVKSGAVATVDAADDYVVDPVVDASKAVGSYAADGAKDTVSNTLTGRLLSSDYSGIKNPALAGAAVMGTVVIGLPLAIAGDIIMAPFKLLIEKEHVDAVIDAGQDKAGDIIGGLTVEHYYADSSDELDGFEGQSALFINSWNNDDVENPDFEPVAALNNEAGVMITYEDIQ